MNFLFSDDKYFEDLWNEFTTENNNASWRYLLNWLIYQRMYSNSNFAKDLSFIILNDKMPIAICSLFLEQCNEKMQFSYANGYQTAPLIKKDLHLKYREKIERICFEKIDELAKEYDASKIMLSLDPLSENYDHNILMEYKYLDSSINTTIVNLSLDKKNLWSNLRKSFKSLINNGKDKFNIFVMDYNNPDFEIHENYRELHHKTSGRVTRIIETFNLQFEMLKEDNAILIGLQHGDRFIAFSYFLHNKTGAYYASASDDPDFETDVPVGHCIIWTAIEYYKKKNLEYLDMGLQQFSHQIFDHPSQKDISLSFFKRGFGGVITPFYRGIKYLDKNSMKQDLQFNTTKLFEDFHYE